MEEFPGFLEAEIRVLDVTGNVEGREFGCRWVQVHDAKSPSGDDAADRIRFDTVVILFVVVPNFAETSQTIIPDLKFGAIQFAKFIDDENDVLLPKLLFEISKEIFLT